MDSVAAMTTMSGLFTISKALSHGGAASRAALTQRCLAARRLRCVCDSYSLRRTSIPFGGCSSASSLASLRATAETPARRRLASVSGSAASFASSGGVGGVGGGFGGESGGGGGGGGSGSDGGDGKSKLAASAADEVSAASTDVIILDVGGMTCGGCAASVKRILESQPQVSSASVNLTTETAVVWPVAEAREVPNWQQQLGEALAKHLTSCGFKSILRVAGEAAIEGDISP